MYPSIKAPLIHIASLGFPVFDFLLNLILTIIVSILLAKVYVAYGNSLSNRHGFSRNFVILALTTNLIITIIGASVALSLGLIGALSIVRFRAAIKEPEELMYLFLVITIGLGFGANQRIITLVAFVTIITVIWLRSIFGKRFPEVDQNLFLTISIPQAPDIDLLSVTKIIDENCSRFRVKRYDKSNTQLEICFLVEFYNLDSIQSIESAINKLDHNAKVILLDFKGTVNTP